ncbi:Sec20-domain-containing protein [Canariomyces notabilis]|uniref:Sec20-domain-containing protein n=1 Tax=Canariomyces notabilis TaxID=2074819 RepID=A0AAN6TL10_9PEZI|nr:Sec20-domain-containing protein [Canariomyces arenarius]
MASFDTLQERLAALQESTSQLKELIDRLANIKFQPGSVPLSTSDEDNVATELATEINQILREEEEDLELLHEEIIDLRSGRPGSDAEHRKTRLKEGAQRLEAELKNCRTAFRKAQLSARRSLEAAQKLERSLLLASYAASATSSPSSSTILTKPNTSNDTAAQSQHHPDIPTPQAPSHDTTTTNPPSDPRQRLFSSHHQRRRQRAHPNRDTTAATSDENSQVVTASSDVTLALRRTHALIAGEVAKSAFAAQTLAESGAALAELQKGYSGAEGLLRRSRELVSDLMTAQKSDTWYLRASLNILLVTLAWLVFRRLMYGPLWWFVWFPVRTGVRIVLAVVGLGAGGGSSTTAMKGGKGGVTGDGLGNGNGNAAVSGGFTAAGARVVGIKEDGAVPTVSVPRGEEKKTAREEGEPDSWVERVGRMVEDTLHPEEDAEMEGVVNNTEEGDSQGDQPNPMKRMWEEEGVGEGLAGQPVRDEL